MKKKALISGLTGIILIIAVFLVLSGVFTVLAAKYAPLREWLISHIPGREVEITKEITAPTDIAGGYDALVKAFEAGKSNKSTECLIPYTLAKLRDYKIEIVGDGESNIRLLNKKNQQVRGIDWISELEPCIVACKDEKGERVTENFYRYYHSLDDKYKGSTKYSKVKGAIIISGDTPTIKAKCPDGTQIDNSLKSNLLYKPDQEHLCFIPTNWEFDYTIDGMEYDRVMELKEGARAKRLPSCK